MKPLLERLAELAPDVCERSKICGPNGFMLHNVQLGDDGAIVWTDEIDDMAEAVILFSVFAYCKLRGWNSVFLFIDETGHCCDIVDTDTDVETGHSSYAAAALSALIKALEAEKVEPEESE